MLPNTLKEPWALIAIDFIVKLPLSREPLTGVIFDFISKTDKKEALLKEGENSLKYSSKIATVYKVIKDPAIEQQIKDTYLRDTRARKAIA